MIQTWIVIYRYSQLEKLNLSVSNYLHLTLQSCQNVFEDFHPSLVKSFSKTKTQLCNNGK
jgi:hypothetical protein